MRQQPHLLLHEDAYLEVVRRYNAAVGDCLGCPIESAADFDDACQHLLGCEWPPGAPQRVTQHQAEFPELAALFTARGPGEPLPAGTLWEEVRLDLFGHEAYRRLVALRSRSYRRQLSRGGPMQDVYAECLPRVSRQLIGRAASWARARAQHCRTQPGARRTWLDLAMHWCRHEVERAIREHLGLPVGSSDRKAPATGALETEPPSAAPGPEEIAQAEERQQAVRAALERLPEEEQQVIECRQNGMTSPQIDAERGWPSGTAQARYRRALRRLRDELQGRFGPGQHPRQG